jgi:DNA (cytosine-5)-methyltransferase 1
MRALELFSGAGGLAKGLELAGFEHSALVEYNKHACSSLSVNFESEKVFFGDIKDFDLNSISAVSTGPIRTVVICFHMQSVLLKN